MKTKNTVKIQILYGSGRAMSSSSLMTLLIIIIIIGVIKKNYYSTLFNSGAEKQIELALLARY